MKVDLSQVEPGIKVKVTNLESTDGFRIASKHLEIREIGSQGTVKTWVPGHGGDVWFIKQHNGIAAYLFTEFEKI